MPISVKDIQEKEFSRQKRDGYNIEEVDDFLDEISDQLSVLIRENMALAEQVSTIDKSCLMEKKGSVTDLRIMEAVTKALQIQIGAVERYN